MSMNPFVNPMVTPENMRLQLAATVAAVTRLD